MLILISDPKCKVIKHGFQTTYNLRSGRFSQRKHIFPQHDGFQTLFLEATNFHIVQIGHILWFFGAYIQEPPTFSGAKS